MGEVKITRCLEECGKQWRPKLGKTGWQKQKEKEKKKKQEKKQEKKETEKKQRKKKQKGEKIINIKRIAKE